MSEPIGESELGSPSSSGSESSYVAQLGRISGKLLQANLVRNGIDLSFRNEANDPDLLYLDVNNEFIGINNDSPTVNLDVTGKIFVSDRMDLVGTTTTFGNVRFNSDGSVTSTVGPINIFTTGPSAQIEVGDILTDSFRLKDNYISGINADQDMIIFANGSGIVEIFADTLANGNVDVIGNINAYSNVRLNGQLIIGDNPVDTVTISPDFKQSIIPGIDNTYTFGSVSKRWDTTWIKGTLISTQANIDEILITEQMRISGNTIDTIRSNDDLTITYKSGQGIVLENLRFDQSVIGGDTFTYITNLSTTDPLVFSSTGTGYLKFSDSNGIRIPFGTNAQRPFVEVGETRWNSDLGYLECFDGSVYIIATGGGTLITPAVMEDLSHVYTLIFG